MSENDEKVTMEPQSFAGRNVPNLSKIILIFLMTSSRSDGGRYQQQIGAGRPGPGNQNISNVLVCRYFGIYITATAAGV